MKREGKLTVNDALLRTRSVDVPAGQKWTSSDEPGGVRQW